MPQPLRKRSLSRETPRHGVEELATVRRVSGEATPKRSGPLLRNAEPEPFRLAGFYFEEGIDVSHALLIDSEATGGKLKRMVRHDALALARAPAWLGSVILASTRL